MFKSAIRAAPRRIVASRSLANPSRRFLSTAPPSQKSRSWKSSAARWALAAGGIYYYNTSNVFAEEPEAAIQQLGESIHSSSESNLPTVDAIVEEKRRREAQLAAEEKMKEAAKQDAVSAEGQAEGEEGSLDGLEEEADQQGAFNPETGEINWDCPCLGGMAHGPCGEEFRAAFSCFVYSKEEPKGVECIEKFKGMQDCFREHPDMYGSELEDDEDEVEEELRARDEAKKLELGSETQKPSSEASPAVTQKEVISEVEKLKTDEPHRENKSPADIAAPSGDEGDELVPRAAHDASSK